MSTRVDITYDSKTTQTFENGGEAYTIIDGKRKYKFYTTKKDGNETKAYEGWKEINPKPHDILPAEVEEEEKEFKNKEGKMVKYTDRRIMYFYTDQREMTKANMPTATKEEVPSGLEARVKALEDWRDSLAPKKAEPIKPSFPSEKKDDIPTINTDDEKEIRIEDVPF